jgi:Ca2+-binding RTX toxin-like protein
LRFIVLVAFVSALCFQAVPAGAATAFVQAGTLRYVADPGEANDVFVDVGPAPDFATQFTDTGVTMTAGSGCASVSPNRVRCSSPYDMISVSLGDGNDILKFSGAVDSGGGLLSGGDGDDRIRGSNNFESSSPERLLGGSGDDSLFGRAGADFLNGGPGADDLSGGISCEAETAGICFADIDTVSYADRTKRVRATADGFAGDDGQRGEGDTIMQDVERIVGGQGNDVLGGRPSELQSIGNGFANPIRLVGMQLLGRGGNDKLNGSRASDSLEGGRGDDVLRGAGGRDTLRGARGHDRLLARDGRLDQVNGGPGRDEGRVDVGLDHVRSVERLL